jgi:diguanylate cyclase (GGDEF)-like protein
VPTFNDGEDTFSSDSPKTTLPARDILSLLVLGGPEAGRYVRVASEGGTIGRAAEAEIHVPDPYVSRNHAVIERDPTGRFAIRDLGSRFGVYVEGKRVDRALLADGQRIQLSNETVLRVRFEDQEETQLLDQMQRAAMTDPLTGLANRRYLFQRLDQEHAFSARHKTPLAILMLDVDHFKELNDAHGHAAGDKALQGLSEILQRVIRREDVIARYGGDEFIIISRGAAHEQVLQFAERIRHGASSRLINVGDTTVHLTLSIGFASYDPLAEPDVGMMELLVRADAALYRSKLDGRDRASGWTASPMAPARKSLLQGDTLRFDYPIKKTLG